MVAVIVQAERTTRRGLRAKVSTEAVTAVADTVIPDSGKVVISGFDKPLRSAKETFFVSNGCDREISTIAIHFVYYDMDGRQLHASDKVIHCSIPPGETRQLSVKAWDLQQSFYFCQSVKPRRDRAIPFSVKYRVGYVVLSGK